MAETCTPKFIDFIKSLVVAEIEFPALKPWILAQAILECGRGITKLFDAYKNPFGMHFHPFLKDLAVGVQYDACDGVGSYASFNSYGCAIKGYFSWFDNWTHYGDWRVAARKGGFEFLSHIAPHYCPPGMTEDWKKAHGGKNYPEYIRDMLLPEAKKLLEDYKDAPKPTDFSDVTWHNAHIIIDEKTRQMEIGLASYAGGTLRALGRFSVDSGLLSAYLSKFPNAKNIIKAEPTKAWPTNIPTDPVKPPPVTGKKVKIDPGHSEEHTGARGKNSNVQEEDLNRYQAEVLKKELAALGVASDIIDPIGDDLYAIGQSAQGYGAFVSLHLNAYDRVEHYTCTMCHSSKQTAGSKSAKVAGLAAQAMASAIGNACFGGSSGWPKGVMAVGLSVLSGASTTNCPIAFLSEMEFVDDESETSGIKARIDKGMKALAKVLADNM